MTILASAGALGSSVLLLTSASSVSTVVMSSSRRSPCSWLSEATSSVEAFSLLAAVFAFASAGSTWS